MRVCFLEFKYEGFSICFLEFKYEGLFPGVQV